MDKTFKVRTIVAALRNTTVDRISATDGEVQARMQHLNGKIDWEYKQALRELKENLQKNGKKNKSVI